jgi:hypothetical protein
MSRDKMSKFRIRILTRKNSHSFFVVIKYVSVESKQRVFEFAAQDVFGSTDSHSPCAQHACIVVLIEFALNVTIDLLFALKLIKEWLKVASALKAVHSLWKWREGRRLQSGTKAWMHESLFPRFTVLVL